MLLKKNLLLFFGGLLLTSSVFAATAKYSKVTTEVSPTGAGKAYVVSGSTF